MPNKPAQVFTCQCGAEVEVPEPAPPGETPQPIECPRCGIKWEAPCGCWSCDNGCGGGCGPTYITHRGPICQSCAKKACVFDDDRTGAQVTITGDRARLIVDVFNPLAARSMWLDIPDIDLLTRQLAIKRAELVRKRLAEHAQSDTCPLCQTDDRTTRKCLNCSRDITSLPGEGMWVDSDGLLVCQQRQDDESPLMHVPVP